MPLLYGEATEDIASVDSMWLKSGLLPILPLDVELEILLVESK